MISVNKLVIVLVIGILIYFLLLNPSQKEVVNTQSVHTLSIAKTFVQGGVAAIRNSSANSNSSDGGSSSTGG